MSLMDFYDREPLALLRLAITQSHLIKIRTTQNDLDDSGHCKNCEFTPCQGCIYPFDLKVSHSYYSPIVHLLIRFHSKPVQIILKRMLLMVEIAAVRILSRMFKLNQLFS